MLPSPFLKLQHPVPNPTLLLHHLTLPSFLLLRISRYTLFLTCLLFLFIGSLAPCFRWARIFILFTDISWTTLTTTQNSGSKTQFLSECKKNKTTKKKTSRAGSESSLWPERGGKAFASRQREHVENTHACVLKGDGMRINTGTPISHNCA